MMFQVILKKYIINITVKLKNHQAIKIEIYCKIFYIILPKLFLCTLTAYRRFIRCFLVVLIYVAHFNLCASIRRHVLYSEVIEYVCGLF